MISDIFNDMTAGVVVKLLAVLISADVIFGILRAIKERQVNSGIGINGILRKAAMILTIVVLYFIDILINVNFISFIPVEIVTALSLREIGLAELFGVILVLFESLSILKNLNLIGLPLPKSVKSALEKFLKTMTDESRTNVTLDSNASGEESQENIERRKYL